MNSTFNKDITLTTFLSWPLSMRAMHLNRKYPNMLPAMKAALLKDTFRLAA